MRFQDGCEKDLTSNQLTVVTVERSPMTKESKVPSIDEEPGETVPSEKRYYCGVFVLLNFHKEDGVGRKEEQVDVGPDPNEEEIEDVRLDDERGRH